MKKIVFSTSLLLLLGGCASTPTITGMKKASDEDAEAVYKAARKGESKFLFDEFSDSYKGENKIKKIGVLYYSIGWDKSQDLRKESGATIDPGNFPDDYQALVNNSMMEMKATFEKLGYQFVTPSELAAKSQTFKALKTQPQFNHYSPTSGQELVGMGVPDSRYVHMMTHEGKLLSQIQSEAPDIDAFIGFNMNSLGKNGSSWLLDGMKFYGVPAFHEAHSFLCVPREKAKKNGVNLGWFGDANDCARAQADFKVIYYLPGQDSKSQKLYEEVKTLGFSNLDRLYKNVARGLVENFYEEGLK